MVNDLPSFRNRVLQGTVGGWQISDLTPFQTGAPFSVLNSTVGDNSGVGKGISSVLSGSARSYPDVTGSIHATPVSSAVTNIQGPRLYNAAAYAAPTGLTFGNAGRNNLRLPRRSNFDVGLFKQFPGALRVPRGGHQRV